jgi:hypothetical protein
MRTFKGNKPSREAPRVRVQDPGSNTIQCTSISCDTGCWIIDTQAIAWMTWRPDDDTFLFDIGNITFEDNTTKAIYSRQEMKAILESEQMRRYMDSYDTAIEYN